MRIVAMALLVCAATSSCRSRESGTEPSGLTPFPSAAASAGPIAAPRTDVDLDDAPPADLFALLERASRSKVIVDAGALPTSVCAKITLHRKGLPLPALVGAVADAIRPAGLALFATRTGWAVHATGDAGNPCERFLPAADAAPTGPDPATLARAIAGIHATAPGHYTVKQATLDLMADPAARLLREVRIVPEVEGTTTGARLFGVRPASLLSALGYDNGDLVESVCGHTTTTRDAFLASFARPDGSATCGVRLVHRQTPQDLEYTFVP